MSFRHTGLGLLSSLGLSFVLSCGALLSACESTPPPARGPREVVALPPPSSAPSASAAPIASGGLSPRPDTQVSVGGTFACAARRGRVYCWGDGSLGQLGNGATDNHPRPVEVRGLTTARVVSTGSYAHACALVDGGKVWCWGANDAGQLGDGTTEPRSAPVEVAGLERVSALAAGAQHNCAIVGDGRVRCWGRNSYGQIGDGTWDERSRPTEVVGVSGAIRVGASQTRSCAELTDGRVTCWGAHGRGASLSPAAAIETKLPRGRHFTMSSGFDLACIISGDLVHCVPGMAPYGQIGPVPGTDRVVTLAAGGTGACMTRTGGAPLCWDYTGRPAAVPGLPDAAQTSQGNGFGCAVRHGGQVACWGNAAQGQLGDGTVQGTTEPVPVQRLSAAVTQLALGEHHTTASTADGLRAWGLDTSGELGDGARESQSTPVPLTLAGAPGDRLVAGGGFTCILHDSTLRCWGRLDESAAITADPKEIAKDVSAAAARGGVLCVVRAGGKVACATEGDVTKLLALSGVDASLGVAVGSQVVCGIGRARGVNCFGLPYRGPIRSMPMLAPEKAFTVPGATDVVEIALAWTTLFTRQRSGAVSRAELAIGPRGALTAATPVPGLTSATGLAAADERVCALGASGAVTCVLRAGPPEKPFDIGASLVAGGGRHFCAALRRGGAMCWGDGTYGQLANGMFGSRARAADVALPP